MAYGRRYQSRRAPRRSAFKRRTPTNKRQSQGGCFKPRSGIPQIKTRKWQWLTVKMEHTQGVVPAPVQVTAAQIAAAAELQINLPGSCSKFMISSVQTWNSAGPTATTANPQLILDTRSQQHGAAADTFLSRQEDDGTLQKPAACGYKWSFVEAATVHDRDNTSSPKIFDVTPSEGQTCLSHVKIHYYPN